MYASEKYMLDVIKIECKKFLTANINDDNACMVLQTAHNFELADLQNDALQFIFLHGKSCLESTSFVGLSSGCVKLIIESEKLLSTEEIVYQNIIQWAEQQCRKEQSVTANKQQHVTSNDEQHVTANEEQHVTANDKQLRKVLGDLIYLIRFPIMEPKYFTSEVSTKNVLTAYEKIEIFQSFHDKPIDTFPSIVRFSKSMVWRCLADVKRVSWNHLGADDCLNFTTSCDCYIFGIIVFGTRQCSGQHDVNINILNDSTPLGSTSTKLNSVPGKISYPIDLTEPLRILKNITYTIQLNIKGNTCFSGTDYQTVVRIDDDACVTFTDSASSPNSTNSTQGQIPGIILSRSYFR
jgi:hypothetical protein